MDKNVSVNVRKDFMKIGYDLSVAYVSAPGGGSDLRHKARKKGIAYRSARCIVNN